MSSDIGAISQGGSGVLGSHKQWASGGMLLCFRVVKSLWVTRGASVPKKGLWWVFYLLSSVSLITVCFVFVITRTA